MLLTRIFFILLIAYSIESRRSRGRARQNRPGRGNRGRNPQIDIAIREASASSPAPMNRALADLPWRIQTSDMRIGTEVYVLHSLQRAFREYQGPGDRCKFVKCMRFETSSRETGSASLERILATRERF